MPKDLVPNLAHTLSWDEENCAESLKAVYDHVAQDARGAIDWYIEARKSKKRWGLFIRSSAVFLISAAGLLPLVSEIWAGKDSTGWWAKPLLASVAVGLAAALVALDKFFGFSSAWMRFITAELTLRTALEDFEIDWYGQFAPLRGQKPTVDQTVQMLSRCKEFVAKINGIVAEETKVWVDEFKSSLSQVDEAVKAAESAAKARVDAAEATAKAQADAARPGALNVEIVNIDKVKLPWTLWVDNGGKRDCSGATAAVAPLKPGQHTVRVFAIVDGKERTAEKVFDVSANTTLDAKITV